jgi:hypothetical protein
LMKLDLSAGVDIKISVNWGFLWVLF